MNPTDPTYARLRRDRNTERAAFLVVIGALLIALYLQWRSPKPCVLSVGGRKVAYVATPNVAKRAKEEITRRFRQRYGDRVRFRDEPLWYPDRPAKDAQVVDLEEAVAEVTKFVRPLVKGTAIEVEGVPLVVVKSQSMADDVLREFMRQYIDANATPIEPPSTREKAEFVEWEGDAQEVAATVQEATEKLASSGSTERQYVVQDGDTGQGIAMRQSLSWEKLQSLNQGVNWDRLKIGQRLCIQKAKSPLTVVTVHETTRVEKIGFTTRRVKSNRLPKGTVREERAGKDGEKEVTYRITSENGIPVGKEPVGEGRVLSRPTERLVIEGTG